MKRAWMNWSSGKDSLFALHWTREVDDIEVVGLLTTVNGAAARVAMHGVRRRLLEEQARRLGLPLLVVELPDPCPNSVYEAKMADAVDRARLDGVDTFVFGDLYLEDVRAYRERMLEGTGIALHVPLWGRETGQLAREMIDSGVRAVLTCVDTRALDASFAGRSWDAALLDDLPESVDPCAERGEFHTFAHAGPGLDTPIELDVGDTVTRDRFVFCDLLLRDAEAPRP